MADERPSAFEASAAAVAGLAGAVLAFLFRARTLLPAGAFDALGVVALSFGLSPLAHRALRAPAATLVQGAGLAGGSLLLAAALVPPFDRAGIPLAAWTGGGALLQAATRARTPLVLSAPGVLLVALGSAFAWSAADAWPETARLRAAIAGATAAAALGLAMRALLARRGSRLTPSPVGVLLVAALGATYLAYRPLVAGAVENLPLYEWTLGVAAAVLLLGRLRRLARETSVDEAWTGEARRHEQSALPAYDPRMPALAAAIQRYLEGGQGFEEYRAAMMRASPHAPPHFRKALQGAHALQGRGRAAKQAKKERLATHDALLRMLDNEVTAHGDTPPGLRTHR